jgi:peptidoglycan/LPS O-acetylase OafA/YrhL
MPEAAKPHRLAYIDWMRGLACLLMFQTHCYDSWLGGSARQSNVHRAMVAARRHAAGAAFLISCGRFLCALVTDRMRRKGVSRPIKLRRTTILPRR